MIVKKLWIVLALAAFLTGCSAQQTFENVLDAWELPVQGQMQQVQVSLPEEASVMTMQAENSDRIYLCDGYTVTVQTFLTGDLQETMQEVTGFDLDQLKLVKTQAQEAERYDCVWTSVGEGGDQVGRAAVLNDGNYHYAVTAMADASVSGELTQVWNDLFSSVSLVSTD